MDRAIENFDEDGIPTGLPFSNLNGTDNDRTGMPETVGSKL
jgi:hypothetical protein